MNKIKSLFFRRQERWSPRPRFYGVAWLDHPREYIIWIPVPLHIIVGALRRLWFALVSGVRPHKLERLRADCKRYERLHDRWREMLNERGERIKRFERIESAAIALLRTGSNEAVRSLYATLYANPPTPEPVWPWSDANKISADEVRRRVEELREQDGTVDTFPTD